MTSQMPDPNLTNLARIHDQILDDYAEGNMKIERGRDVSSEPPWVDDYERDPEADDD